MKIRYTTMSTPVGPIAVAWTGNTVLSLDMDEATNRTGWDSGYRSGGPLERLKQRLRNRFGEVSFERQDDGAPAKALAKYFAGDARALDRLDADPGGTPFQASVWDGLRRIPAGHTMTYGELAQSVGKPRAARAAGGAVGSNPIPLIIPCHRIIGSDRKLTGFGGGLKRKRWLLEHEGARFRV